jgi:hypothetical protein
MAAVIDWILATDLSHFVLEYRWVWPISEAVHFMGLVLLVGTVSMFDLRVLGMAKGISPAAIHRLLPFGLLGFALSVATGLMFISGTPDQYFYNSAFHLKAVFLFGMGLNVAYFYSSPFRAVRFLEAGDTAPRAARISAALSLLIMIGVMSCGRMLTFFRPPAFY